MFTGLDFTTLARMRNILGFAENDLERDAELSRLIRTVSADMEDDMRRFVRQTAYVEILTLWPPARILSLSGVPVLDTPTPVLVTSNQRDFVTSPTALTRGVDYVLENETGTVRFINLPRGVPDPVSGYVLGPAYVQATYTGGLASTISSFETNYPQLTQAAEMQVAYLYKRQLTPGGNVMLGANSTGYEQAMNWLPSVRRILDYHKRRSVC